MPRILHILTRENDSLAEALLDQQRRFPEVELEVVDLTKPEPNYEELLAKVFAADSIEVW